MAGEALELEDDALEAEALSPETPAEAAEPDDEMVISFDGDGEDEDAPEGAAPDWVKDVRRKNRELERENAELKAKTAPAAIEIGEKPTLAGCDYDEERFETELDAFKDRKAKAEEGQTRQQAEAQRQQQEWQADLSRLAEQEKALKVPDYKDARDDFVHATSDMQQATIVKASKNSAQLIYALGKNPARLAALAEIKDPIKLAVAVSELERGLKMTTRRRAPEPEAQVRGSAPLSRGSNSAEKQYETMSNKPGIDRGELRKFREKNGLDVQGKALPARR